MTLQAFLLALLSGSVAIGPIVFSLFEQIPALQNINADRKRIAVAGTALLISLSAWGLAIWLGFIPLPTDRQAVAQAIWQYGILAGLSAFTSSQVIHGLKEAASDRSV